MHMLVHEAAHSHDLLHEVLFMNWVYAYVNELDVCTCGRRTMQTRQVVSTDQTTYAHALCFWVGEGTSYETRRGVG